MVRVRTLSQSKVKDKWLGMEELGLIQDRLAQSAGAAEG